MKNNEKKSASTKSIAAKPQKPVKKGTVEKTALKVVDKKKISTKDKKPIQKTNGAVSAKAAKDIVVKQKPADKIKSTAKLNGNTPKNKGLKAKVTNASKQPDKDELQAKSKKKIIKPEKDLKVKDIGIIKKAAPSKMKEVVKEPLKASKVKSIDKKATPEKKPITKAIEKVKEVIDNVLEALPDFFSDKDSKDIKSIPLTDLDADLQPIPKSATSKPRRKSGKSKSKANAAALEAAAAAEYALRKASLPDLSNVNYNHFKRGDRREPEKIEAEPSILIKTEVKKADAAKADIKNKILDTCLAMQSNSVNLVKKAMNDAQESANEEKGSMEEKFDSFRESMHITRDMYARQLQEGVNSLSILKRINGNLEHNTIILGSVVYTDFQNYFISVSLGEILVDKDRFVTISTLTPLFQALNGKSKGDKFKLRDKTYTILEVF